jgi:hypothetical protein
MWTYIGTGLAVFALIVLLGIGLRASHAGWISVDPGTFYSILSLRGVGMIVAVAISGLGLLWYLVRQEVEIDYRARFVAYRFFLAGVLVAAAYSGDQALLDDAADYFCPIYNT